MELLVVMAIIAILASLAFVVLGASGNAAREASTKSMIRILSGALRERVDAFHEITASASQIDPDLPQRGSKTRVFREKVDTFRRWYLYAHPPLPPMYAPQPQPSAEVSEVFVRKAMYKALFPQRRADLFGYDGVAQEINGIPDDSPILIRMYSASPPLPSNRIDGSWVWRNFGAATQITSSTDYQTITDNPATESSEMLYLILTEGDVFGMPPADISGIDSRMIGDTDGDGNLEFLDGWGRPLQFYNWPTRLIKDDGSMFTGVVTSVEGNQYKTSSLLVTNLPRAGATGPVSSTVARNRADRDPEDPTRRLSLPSSSLIVGSGTFDLRTKPDPAGDVVVAQKFNSDWYHDLNTVTMPLIVSAGQDGILGLHLPTESGTSGTNHTDRLARVIHTDEACQALGDNITNQQRGPQ